MKASPGTLGRARNTIQRQADKNVMGMARIAGTIPSQGVDEEMLTGIDTIKKDTKMLTSMSLEEAVDSLELAQLLYDGVMMKYPDAVKNHGHEVVGDAIMDTAEDAGTVSSMSEAAVLVDEIIQKLQNKNSDAGFEPELDEEDQFEGNERDSKK